MRQLAGDRAGERWDRAHALFRGTPEPDTWSEVRERHDGNLDAARLEYNAQERVRVVREHDDKCRREERWDDCVLGLFSGIEQYAISRDEFVRNARDEAICPYAYVIDGRWHAPGQMGWFGLSSDTDEDRRRFAREFNELFDSLSDDTLLTLCDAHI